VYKKLAVNMGANYARNTGFECVKGDYIIFCDADVFFYPNAIDKMLDVIKKCEVDFVYSNFLWKKDDGNLIHMKALEWDVMALYKQNYISFVSLVKKEVAEVVMPLNKGIERLQDWDFWLKLAGRGYIGKHIDEELFIAILKSSGISGGDKEEYFKWKQIIQKKHRKWINAISARK